MYLKRRGFVSTAELGAAQAASGAPACRPRAPWAPTGVLGLLCLGVAACAGSIGASGEGANDDEPSPTPRAGAGGSPMPGTGGMTATQGPLSGDAPMRRLTNQEYARTLADLLDLDVGGLSLPPEEEVHGFKNNAEALTFSPVLAERHLLIAETLSSRAVMDLPKLTGCGEKQDEDCAKAFISRLGQRAWRRPLEPTESANLLDMFREGSKAGFTEGVRLVVQALLMSPSFAYRTEQGEGGPDGQLRPTSWEMASRLSYLMWGTMPDAELFAAAADDKLKTEEQVLAQAERLLKSPRSRLPIQEFFVQWLGLEGVQTVTKDAKAYPGFSAAVAESQSQEIAKFLEAAFWSDEGGFADLFTSKDTFVNSVLAKHYQLPEPAGATFEKRTFPDDNRAGILTMGGLMAKLAAPDQTSPTLRGVFVRERVLCYELEPPPVSVDNVLPSPTPATTTRGRVNDHQADPTCSGCHRLFDPIGFGFERFDAEGRLRDTDGGKPVDDSGEVFGSSIGSFRGAAELGRKLAADEGAARCMATNFLRFALGRSETPADENTVTAMKDQLLSGDKPLWALIPTLVTSDRFVSPSSSQGVKP